MSFLLKWIFNITLVLCSVISSDLETHGGSDVKTFRTEQFFFKHATQAVEESQPHRICTDSFSLSWTLILDDHDARVRTKEKSLMLDERAIAAILSDLKFIHPPAMEPFAHTVS
jgi:hypothetical protein